MKPLSAIVLLIAAFVLVVMPQGGETSLSFCRASSKLLSLTSADSSGDDDNDDDDDDDSSDSSSSSSHSSDSSSSSSHSSGSSSSSSGGSSAPNSFTIIPPPIRCEKGPVTKIFTATNEFYWPPIYRRSCAGLKCDDPPCFARKRVWRTRCVLVYRLVNGWWRRIGFRTRGYYDDLQCGCKRCEDIRRRTTCIATKPCPNSKHSNTFCYWKFSIGKREAAASSSINAPTIGRCLCCKPVPCPKPKIFSRSRCSCVCPPVVCAPGRIFNPRTCGCDCPKGTQDINGKCVGDCDDISVNTCKFIFCRDNPQLKCAVRNNKCVCQSCDASESAASCVKTRCLEQKGRPTCVYDTRAKRCRCPRCSDITNRDKCLARKPCPESTNSRSFCFWLPTLAKGAGGGECACCTPKSCSKPRIFDRSSCSCVCPSIKCPPGRVFNAVTCKCDCPKGTKDVDGKCIGDCAGLSTSVCPNINCDDNPMYKCQVRVVNHKKTCVCPSCEAARDRPWCVKTRCLEQRTKPKCVYDSHSRKCRCPECSDQDDKKWCLLTYCGPYNNRQCRYDHWKKKCFCPH